MNSQVTGLRVASIVFAIMAGAQLCRLIIRPEILVADHVMPLWPSMIAAPVLAALSFWMWKLSMRS
jgi:hypothetical protein